MIGARSSEHDKGPMQARSAGGEFVGGVLQEGACRGQEGIGRHKL